MRPAIGEHLLVEGLGVGGGGRNVGIAGSLVRAGGELELVGRLQVGIAGGAVGGGVILEVEKESEHFCTRKKLVRRLLVILQNYINYDYSRYKERLKYQCNDIRL
mmetsp:Transcript_41680/g.87038  ORF Transcript_41680/g.87038 Transcript_41680/m.87038 type:complete len:105 (-) Transcript_41680:93-407(-)